MNSTMILRSPNLTDGEAPVVVRLYEKSVSRFARGGLASAAHSVRSAGRGGDDVLLHINPKEYEFLRHVWGEPSTNPHTGLPEYGLFSKLKKALKFETFNVKGIVKDIAKNPQRLLVGAVDPIGTKIANKALGTKWKPAVNQFGGATEQRFRDAEAQGMDTGTARTLHGIAKTIAAYYGGNALGNLASEGLGSVSQGLQGTTATGADALTEAVPTVDTIGSTGAINAVVPTAQRVGTGFTGTTGSALKDAAISALDKGQGELSNLGDKATDYAKDPKNWGTILKAAPLVAGLAGLGGSQNQGASGAPEMPKSPGLKQLPFGRAQSPQNFNWYTYGEGPEQAFYNTNEIPAFTPDDESKKPAGAAQGGAASRYVRGPGTGRSDSIDAKLSDGEYVLTAEDVALLGDGSSEAGAKRLDAFRKNLRKHKGAALAKGKISPNAKSPLAYLKRD